MIYINPRGGFGNSLFQLAAMYVIATENNDEFCILNHKKHINDLTNDVRLKCKHAFKYDFIFDKFKQLDFAPVEWEENQEYSKEFDNNFSRYYLPFEYTVPQYLSEHEYIGYFQCEKYFMHRRAEILELFKPTDEIINEVNKYKYLFNSIGLHVRRGDYVKQHQGRYIYLDLDYYNKGLSMFPENIPVLVFSDDLDWCRENFTDERFIFINELDYISLYLISKMKYFIIANSSFSWWGAWLGEAEKVIAPKEWFGNDVVHKQHEYDIIPNKWIKI